jgi:hypothetical protein
MKGSVARLGVLAIFSQAPRLLMRLAMCSWAWALIMGASRPAAVHRVIAADR